MNLRSFLLFSLSIQLLFLSKEISAQKSEPDSTTYLLSLDDVVVTALYAPTDSRNALYKIRSIKKDVIEQRGAVNLEQLLNQELTIRISQDMILGGSLSLLGVSGQNVKIMIDGVPVIGRVGDDIDLSQIMLSNIERVELIEGPMSIVYGTNALGGVINLITKKTQADKYQVHVSGQLESIGSLNSNVQLGMRLSDKLQLRIDGGLNDFDGYNSTSGTGATSDRTFDWNPKRQYYTNASVLYDLGKDRQLRYYASVFDENIDNLGEIRRPQFKPYAFDDYYYTRRLDQSLSYEGKFLNHLYWNVLAGYNTFDRKKNTERLDLETNDATLVEGQQDTTRYNAFVFRPILASRYPASIVNFQAGLDVNYENGTGQRLRDPQFSGAEFSEITDLAAFASVQLRPIKALELQLGSRSAYNSRFKTPLIPSLHLKYAIAPDWQLRASYAMGFRSPSIKELFFYFVDLNHFILGNPDLQAEKAHNYQLIVDLNKKKEQHRFQATATAFYNDIRNKINLYDFVEVDGKFVPAAALGRTSTQFSYFNQDRFKSIGGNIRASYVYKSLNISAGIAPTGYYNFLSELESQSKYTFVDEVNAQISYQINKIGLTAAFFIRYNDKFIRFYQDVDDQGNTIVAQSIQDGFSLSDLTLKKSFWKNRVQLIGGIKNLFDITNVNISGMDGAVHSSGEGTVPVALGRNYFLRLSFDTYR